MVPMTAPRILFLTLSANRWRFVRSTIATSKHMEMEELIDPFTLHQGILWSGFQEQRQQSIHYGIQAEDRFPILPKDIQANITLSINVRMINLHSLIGNH